MFSAGTSIPSGSDLDDYTAYGRYNVSSSTAAAGIENSPITNVGYGLFVIRCGAAVVQIAVSGFSGAATSDRIVIFMRACSTSDYNWRSWFGITGQVAE